MSKPSKGGHVRGAVVPQAGGVVTGGSGFLTLANGVAMWVSMTLTNAGAINGFVEVSQSINGAPYVKLLTLGQNPLAPLNNTPFIEHWTSDRCGRFGPRLEKRVVAALECDVWDGAVSGECDVWRMLASCLLGAVLALLGPLQSRGSGRRQITRRVRPRKRTCSGVRNGRTKAGG